MKVGEDDSLLRPAAKKVSRAARSSFGTPKPETYTTYTVTPDDTLIGIAYYHHMR